MIKLNNITVKTREPILVGCNYIFYDNMIYGVIAHNGSGKTTLFRAMTNLVRIQEGSILYDDLPMEKIKQNLFYFESSEWLDGNLNGMDYLRFVKDAWKSKTKIEDVIRYWEMDEYIKVPIKKYSLGMKQRLLISLYMISDAKYLIMDEITNGLDQDSRKHFFDWLMYIKKNKTIILSSHYKDELVEVCDSLLFIKKWSLCGE